MTAPINRQENNSWQRKQNMAKHTNAAVYSRIHKSGLGKHFLSLHQVKRELKEKKASIYIWLQDLNFF